MKRNDFITILLLGLIAGYTFSSTPTTKALGQTTSSSSGTTEASSSGSSTTSSSGTTETSPASSSGSQTSSGSTISISDSFNGIWQAKIEKTITVNGTVVKNNSRKIVLRFCVIDGQLKGLVNHPGFFKNSLIVSSEAMSPTTIKLTLKDIIGRVSTLNLSLNADTLTGTFDNGVTFNAIKRNSSNPRSFCSKVGDKPAASATPSPSPAM